MYISYLSLKNLRCFEDAAIDLRYPDIGDSSPAQPQNINLILGGNGSGKTTLLKAIALSVLTPIIRDCGYVSHLMVREKAKMAIIRSFLCLDPIDSGTRHLTWPTRLDIERMPSGTEKLKVTLAINKISKTKSTNQAAYPNKKIEKAYFEERHPSFFIAGYGATRRMESGEYNPGSISKRRMLRYHRVASLFEDNEALTPLASWLHKFRENPKKFAQILELINRLLPTGTALLNQRKSDGEYLFKQRGMVLPFSALSDGYRAYIAWITDLVFQLASCSSPERPLNHMRGVVLVDEIDLHLHPEWQLKVIDRVASGLPNIQFIFTTHSPIVAGTLPFPPLVLKEETPGTSTIKQLEEDIHGMNAEQILLSPYFEMESTRAESRRKALDDLARRAEEGDMKAARSYLRAMTASREKLGSRS